MTHARTGALLGVAAALLMTAPTAAAEPTPTTPHTEPVADAVLAIENGSLELDAESEPLAVPAATERVSLTWNTTAIEPGTVFGDTVKLRTSVADASTPAALDAAAHDEPVVVPVASSGTVEVDAPPPGEHLLRVEATAHTLDGSPLTITHDYSILVAEEARPAIAAPPQPLLEAPVTAAQAPAQPEPQPRLAAAAQPSPTATGRVTLDHGHVDALAPRLLADGLHIQVKDGTATGTTTWREPADVEFAITAAARTELPAQPVLSFLGEAGKQIFLLPQTQQGDLLWTGWSTEELRPAEVSGPMTWTLTAVDGPGAFGLFTTGSFGAPSVIFNSTDGLPDNHSVALGTHAHANWAFAEPGRYRLTFAVAAPGAGGGTLTDTETYTFVVGDGTTGTNQQQQQQQPGTTDRQAGTPTSLASTGPAAVPATAGLALGLIVTGAAVLVLTRRRPAQEIS
ncbi:choice-of-anchor M domain-containing protein [Umezawaea sp.]|uniref:choice-of-anchor M domain-containing protein n=1 Tax=Umezawaea sp. TaxID=1955258 RepID=UPI002ED6BF71